MKEKYPQVKDGEWIAPKRRGFKLICCECGLVHKLNFRVVKGLRGNQIQFQALRDMRATGQIRRHKKGKGKLMMTKRTSHIATNDSDLCICGHRRKDHSLYAFSAANKKGSRYVCTVNGCSKWNLCDLK